MSTDEMLTISRKRVQRVVDVLSLLSLDEFDRALAALSIDDHLDRFSFLEESLNVFVRDLVEARRANEKHVALLEAQRRELQAKVETIHAQEVAIRELSTPIIEIWDDILTLPVVGVVDTERSLEMTEQLLHRVAEGGYRCVIIDVTGVNTIDTSTADHFIKMIRSAQLLGAYCVVTGMSPRVTQTLVGIGVDMSGFRTLRNLKVGLRDCMRHLEERGAGARVSQRSVMGSG